MSKLLLSHCITKMIWKKYFNGYKRGGYNTTNPPASINSLVGMSTVFSPVTGGYYIGGSLNNPGNGYWWSTTAYSEYGRYGLGFNGSSLYTDGSNRGGGFYVRCLRAPELQLNNLINFAKLYKVLSR